jgi:hypothetical protein
MAKCFAALCASVGLAALLISNGAQAGSKIVDYIDGTPTTLKGTIETNSAGNVDPFVVQVYAGQTGTECVVITGVGPLNFDATATLVAPDGTVWFNDDGNGSLRPKIKAITFSRGWHVLTISTYAGFAGTRDITLTYARYAGTSQNCANPTPTITPMSAKAKVPPAE